MGEWIGCLEVSSGGLVWDSGDGCDFSFRWVLLWETTRRVRKKMRQSFFWVDFWIISVFWGT